MKAHRGVVLTAIFLMAGAGCGADTATPEQADDLLYLRTSTGVSLVKAGSSSPTFHSVTAEAAPDWGTVVQAEHTGGPRSGGYPDRTDAPTTLQTDLTAVDPVTDEMLWEKSIPGRMDVKVVSPGARYVALAPDTGRYLSRPGQTRLTITGGDVATPRTIELTGNYEPEAFSVDGKHLFVVRYLPAANPNRYQVRRMNVATGKVRDVYSVDKELQEAMRGTARVQEMSPDGKRLYTLYSVDTPEGRHSFVHVLSLDELWAHCIDLPHGFAMRGDKRSALGVTPDNERIYVADTAEGMVAELDAHKLTVARTTELDLASAFSGAELTVAQDGESLFVGSGVSVVQLSTDDLAELGRWEMPDGINGIQSSDSPNIYVGTKKEVVVIDTETGRETETFDLPGLGSIKGLGPVTPGLDPARTRIICGC